VTVVRFRDRVDAGCQLAALVAELDLSAPLVLGLPRGGVPVAAQVAHGLGASLDVVVARKIGAPGHEEYGVGAIAEGGGVVADDGALDALGISPTRFAGLVEVQRIELDRRVRAYRGDRPLPDLALRDVVLVDDGLATGVTAEAAIRGLRNGGARRIVLSIPTCARSTADRLRRFADEVVFVEQPSRFRSVGERYADFTQTTDDEVIRLLSQA